MSEGSSSHEIIINNIESCMHVYACYKINNMSKVMNMNKIEVTFPSADPSCQLSGDLTLPLDGGDETKLLPAIVIVAGSGVSYMLAQYY